MSPQTARSNGRVDAPPPLPGGARQRHESIYAALRERIALLDYEPGRKLSEMELAEEFGISRTPIRRVLARLESEGLLRSVQSVGTVVADPGVETLRQTFELRMELAELIGRLNPVPVTDDLRAAFRAMRGRFDGLDPSPRSLANLNIEFMHLLVSLTENEPLREISERLYYRTARLWIRSIDRMSLEEEIEMFRREVADIAEAVEIGDLAAVGHIRRAHISMSYRRLALRAGEEPQEGA